MAVPDTFWNSYFGMFADNFDINWNGSLETQQHGL